MCAAGTCMPTPDQARELIRRGYGARLARYEPIGPQGQMRPAFIAPALAGAEGETLRSTSGGPCTCFVDGKCELHAAGLKPEEGRIASHDRSAGDVRLAVYRTWMGRRYASVLATLNSALAR